MTETNLSGIIVAGLAVCWGSLGFALILWVYQDFQDCRDKRRNKK